MTKFNIQKVPKGFRFPVRTRALKEFIRASGASFGTVSMGGISSSEDQGSVASYLNRFWVGILRASRREGAWTFDLELQALREEHLLDSEQVALVIVEDIAAWTSKKLAAAETSPEEPRSLFLTFRNQGGVVTSASHEVRVDK